MQFEPQIQIKKVIKTTGDDYAAQSANTTNVEDAVTQLSEGKVEYFVYKTEEGDTLESIAKDKGISVKKLVTLNFGGVRCR